ncbi:MAG: hypothetical protein IH987_09420 [Planctomycetes bacterium]|nr:hypothetical protein [Planctomycetota bacterium]
MTDAFKITPDSDGDGDGFDPPADCDDADPNVNPGATEPDNGLDDGTSDMDPTMNDGPTAGRATPVLCGAAMMGTFLMILLGLLSLSIACRRGHVLPRR